MGAQSQETRQTQTKLVGRNARSAGMSALWAIFPGICFQATLPMTYEAPALAHSLNSLPPSDCALTLKTFACSRFSPPRKTGKCPGASKLPRSLTKTCRCWCCYGWNLAGKALSLSALACERLTNPVAASSVVGEEFPV